MSNYSKMYWLTRLDNIQGLLAFLIVISIIVLIICYVGRLFVGDHLFNEEKNVQEKLQFEKSCKWAKKVSYPLLIISLVLTTFLPSKNDMILIYAGGKTMDFVQNDSAINKIPAQTTKIISDYLDKTINDLNKK